VASGFRRSLARYGGRSIAALAIVAIVAETGAGPSLLAGRPAVDVAPAAAHPARASRPALHAAAPVTSGADSATAATLASTDLDAAAGAGVGIAEAADPNAGLQPSIQYEEAEKHAADRIDFTPGGRVAVGFQPRAGDPWTVGGARPAALPAGRLDGKAMRSQGKADSQGPDAGASVDESAPDPSPAVTPDAANDAPVDASNDDADAIDATNASYRAGTTSGGPAVEPTIEPAAVISPNGLRREIFGFLPYWQVNSSTLRLDYAKISTIAYFGVGADAYGNLQKRNPDGSVTVGWSGWTSSKMTSIISAAHASRTRVVLTVQSFGWSTSGLDRQRQLLGSSTRRLNLAKQIAAAVRDRGADGVNLDFEPLAATYDAEFTALVRSVRSELNKVHLGYQVTFDTLGSIGNYPIEAATAAGGADAIFVMGYDYRTAGSSPVGSIAPLTRTGYDIRETIAAYTARVPASKVILGVPYYGRAWSTSSSVLHATNTSGTKFGDSTTVVYDNAVDVLAEHGRKYDATEGVAWTAYVRENCTATYGCVTSWRQLYVDDAAALGAKYDLVNSYGLRGAGIWALGYDGTRTELWAAIQRKFVTDTTPPVSGVRTLPAGQPNPGFTVSWIGRDDVAVKSYDVQVSADGGAWATWLSATTATSAVWYGFDPHTYAFRVRARDPKGNLGPFNVIATSAGVAPSLAIGGFGVVTVDALSIRSTPGVGAATVGELGRGDLVAILSDPVAVDGFTWYRAIGPLTEWGVVAPIAGAAWIPTSGGRVSPAKAPNATRVQAALGDLGFGNAGPASIGSAASAVAHRAFSPNGDGSGDTLALDWTNDRTFDSLVLRVFRADGTLVGDVPLPTSVFGAGARQIGWNGKVGATGLANGRYLVSLVGSAAGTVFYNPVPAFRSAALALYGVTIDTVAPTVTSASASGSLLSPNGDGILDTVRVAIAASGADRWTFSAAPVSGATVGAAVTTRSGAGGSAAVVWNGRTNAGALVADGTYRLTLSAIDAAANRSSRSWTVRVDATPATLTAVASPAAFSPNGDGVAETTRLAWTSSERITGVARVLRGTTVVRSWTISGATAGAVFWNGTNASGTAVPDGQYTFRVTGRDAAGNLATRAAIVVVDRTLAAVRWSRSAFYPQDGDAIAPSARVSFVLRRSAVVTVGIYAGATLVRTVWTDRALAAGTYGWTWDGRDSAGVVLARGTYTVRVTARSWVGTSVASRGVLSDAFRIGLSAASVGAGQTLTVTLTTTEALKAAPVVVFAQPGLAAVTRTATSLGSGVYRVSVVVAPGAAGIATLRITGRDTAGGLNVSLGAVTIR
jgi:spore germination protein YaaH/flagellar hook assembly protein FlgD